MYYIRQREDSIAINELNEIIKRFPEQPLSLKAGNLIRVLRRRSQIEEELTNLVINRPPEDTTRRYNPSVTINNNPPAKTGTDTSGNVKPVVPPITINNKPVTDTTAKPVQPPPTAATPFVFAPNDAYYVAFVLNKVDPVYMNEAKNAFFRYNRETFYNKQFTIELIEIDAENRLMLISPFKNAEEAVSYVEKTRPKTAGEIVPWLKGGKYYFSIITDRNLEILKQNKNLDGYKSFLDKNLPGKF